MVNAKHLCDRQIGQNEKRLFDLEFVKKLRADLKAARGGKGEELVVVKGSSSGDCVREASEGALRTLSFLRS